MSIAHPSFRCCKACGNLPFPTLALWHEHLLSITHGDIKRRIQAPSLYGWCEGRALIANRVSGLKSKELLEYFAKFGEIEDFAYLSKKDGKSQKAYFHMKDKSAVERLMAVGRHIIRTTKFLVQIREFVSKSAMEVERALFLELNQRAEGGLIFPDRIYYCRICDRNMPSGDANWFAHLLSKEHQEIHRKNQTLRRILWDSTRKIMIRNIQGIYPNHILQYIIAFGGPVIDFSYTSNSPGCTDTCFALMATRDAKKKISNKDLQHHVGPQRKLVKILKVNRREHCRWGKLRSQWTSKSGFEEGGLCHFNDDDDEEEEEDEETDIVVISDSDIDVDEVIPSNKRKFSETDFEDEPKFESLQKLKLDMQLSNLHSEIGWSEEFLQQSINYINSSLSSLNIKYKKYPFGDLVTGMSLRTRPLLQILIDVQGGKANNKAVVTAIIEKYQKTLSNLRSSSSISCSKIWIPNENVDSELCFTTLILNSKETSSSETEVRLRFGNVLPLQECKLFKLYCDLDVRVEPLARLLTYWAETLGLLQNSTNQSYPSQCILLLVICFLQHKKLVHSVQKLQEWDSVNPEPQFVSGINVSFCSDLSIAIPNKLGMLEDTSIRALSVLGLLKDWFEFYSCADLKENAICTRFGCLVAKKDFHPDNVGNLPGDLCRVYRFGMKKSISNKKFLRAQTPLCIQNPFDLSMNCSRGITPSEIAVFQSSCKEAVGIVSNILTSDQPDLTLFLQETWKMKHGKMNEKKKAKVLKENSSVICDQIEDDEKDTPIIVEIVKEKASLIVVELEENKMDPIVGNVDNTKIKKVVEETKAPIINEIINTKLTGIAIASSSQSSLHSQTQSPATSNVRNSQLPKAATNSPTVFPIRNTHQIQPTSTQNARNSQPPKTATNSPTVFPIRNTHISMPTKNPRTGPSRARFNPPNQFRGTELIARNPVRGAHRIENFRPQQNRFRFQNTNTSVPRQRQNSPMKNLSYQHQQQTHLQPESLIQQNYSRLPPPPETQESYSNNFSGYSSLTQDNQFQNLSNPNLSTADRFGRPGPGGMTHLPTNNESGVLFNRRPQQPLIQGIPRQPLMMQQPMMPPPKIAFGSQNQRYKSSLHKPNSFNANETYQNTRPNDYVVQDYGVQQDTFERRFQPEQTQAPLMGQPFYDLNSREPQYEGDCRSDIGFRPIHTSTGVPVLRGSPQQIFRPRMPVTSPAATRFSLSPEFGREKPCEEQERNRNGNIQPLIQDSRPQPLMGRNFQQFEDSRGRPPPLMGECEPRRERNMQNSMRDPPLLFQSNLNMDSGSDKISRYDRNINAQQRENPNNYGSRPHQQSQYSSSIDYGRDVPLQVPMRRPQPFHMPDRFDPRSDYEKTYNSNSNNTFGRDQGPGQFGGVMREPLIEKRDFRSAGYLDGDSKKSDETDDELDIVWELDPKSSSSPPPPPPLKNYKLGKPFPVPGRRTSTSSINDNIRPPVTNLSRNTVGYQTTRPSPAPSPYGYKTAPSPSPIRSQFVINPLANYGAQAQGNVRRY